MTVHADRGSPVRFLGALLQRLDQAVQILCVLFLGVILFAVTWQVLSRYVTRASSSWTVDVAALAFVWLSMLAIALGVRHGRHMALDIWEYVPGKRVVAVTVATVASLIALVTITALAWYGFQALPSAMRRQLPGLHVSSGWVSLAVPVGACLAALFTVEAWARTVFHRGEGDPLPSAVILQPRDEITVKGEL